MNDGTARVEVDAEVLEELADVALGQAESRSLRGKSGAEELAELADEAYEALGAAEESSTDALHELAHVERLLRADTRAESPTVEVGKSAARLVFDTWEPNRHARGSLTASVAGEIAATRSWGLSTVHDPRERDEGHLVESMVTVVRTDAEGSA